jgi:hypothetical protein
LVAEGLLLTREENRIRVVLEGSDDVLEMSRLNGVWVTEHCEPVWISMEWDRPKLNAATSEEDFVCCTELAAIHLLYSGDEEEQLRMRTTGWPGTDLAGSSLM